VVYLDLKERNLASMERTEEGKKRSLGDILDEQTMQTQELGKVYDESENLKEVDQATKGLEKIQFFWEGLIEAAKEAGDEKIAEEIRTDFLEVIFGLEDERRAYDVNLGEMENKV
jgi:hypothetical protein